MATRRRANDPVGEPSPSAAMPTWIRPRLPTPANNAPDGPGWLHEV